MPTFALYRVVVFGIWSFAALGDGWLSASLKLGGVAKKKVKKKKTKKQESVEKVTWSERDLRSVPTKPASLARCGTSYSRRKRMLADLNICFHRSRVFLGTLNKDMLHGDGGDKSSY